jgi:ABC-type transport system involved in cytochrome c biogenesis permease subunit
MINKKVRPPYVLPIASILLSVLGYLYSKFILIKIPEQTRIDNVIMIAVPFICYFVAIILVYIFLINVISQFLNHKISPKIYKPLNLLFIAGIIGGILLMLQPFTIVLFRISFMVVLVSLLLFMVWSHVIPAAIPEDEEE